MLQLWHGLAVGLLGSIYAALMIAFFFNKSLKGLSLIAGLIVGTPLLITWWIMLMRDEVIAVFLSVAVIFSIFSWLKGK